MCNDHLPGNTLVIRADAATQIGTGHIMRCLALAQAWQDQGGEVTFVSHCESNELRKRLIDEEVKFVAVDKPHLDPSDIERTLAVLHRLSAQNRPNPTWLVVDGYHFDANYQKRIKEAGYKLLWIDDYGHADHYHADFVLNQNISADESFYTLREPYTRLLLGTSYALLRREFKKWQTWQREIPTVARKVLVTLGGSDPDNMTLKVIKAIKQINLSGLEAKIVVGPSNPNLQSLEQEISNYSNLQIIKNAGEMPELMKWADAAVTAAGSTCWELAFMGVPSITGVTFENQAAVAKGLEKANIFNTVGWFKETNNDVLIAEISALLKNRKQRVEKSRAGRHLIDGNGAGKIVRSLFA